MTADKKIFRGVVARGAGRGKRLGFPTANIPCIDKTLSGTYAGVVTLAGVKYRAAVYCDMRRGLLEAHILDFDQDIYGREIEIHLLKRVALDKRVESDEELRAHIKSAVEAARKYFEH